ncbi:hypothetical protein [Anabaena sp. PCC 7108]|uniref:hypothetical protein n=1 Tax=Anabaena sp. PCC 7108 TaxID=163908 RepID=UPI000346C610|nr:hypothetical protein [Anabaena sp. PCC 7108]
MTRQPHDQFAKEYLQELLTSLGNVETSKDVKSEVREIDVWFVPNNSTPSDELELGLLAKMAVTSSLFEPFRNAPSEVEIRSCLLKLFTVHSDLLRQAKREKQSIPEGELPYLWILTPSCSVRMLNGFSAQLQQSLNWCDGVYFLPEFLKTAIVAINQLPISQDTLWLRVLGKGRTQKQAVEELVKLSEDTDKWNHLLEILASWRKNIEVKDNVNDEERELIMNLSPAYLKQREEWRQEGLQEGSLDGQRFMVKSLLAGRFGALDEELSKIVNSIMELSLTERTDLLLNLSNISREELLARFRN